jgi:hypothetical protein
MWELTGDFRNTTILVIDYFDNSGMISLIETARMRYSAEMESERGVGLYD